MPAPRSSDDTPFSTGRLTRRQQEGLGNRLKVLFLSAWFPAPPDNGSRIRVYNLLRSIAERHELALLSFVRSGETGSGTALESICPGLETVPWKAYDPNRSKSVLGLFSLTPRSLVDTYSPIMAERARNIGARQVFDAVIASTIEMAQYALMVPAKAHILEEHNFTTRVMREQWERQTRRLARARYWLTWEKYRRFEARLYPKFDAVTMVSPLDCQAVRNWVPLAPRVELIPNGIDLREYPWGDIIADRDTVIFPGSITFPANHDAVGYFLTEIWPKVITQRPDARIKITGRLDGIDSDRLANLQGVELTGHVEDIKGVIRDSSVCVVPIRTGGGTRFKILEAMALGTPVVSTTKGAEGLEVTHGENILIADNAAKFADFTREVMENPSLRSKLRVNARRLVQAKYDWAPIGANFDVLLQATVSRRML